MTHSTVLPSPTALAHRIRYGAQTRAELAREHGVTWQAVQDRLEAGGFDGHGHPTQPEPPDAKPRLKDADTGAGHHVAGGDARLPTGPVVYGPPPERQGFDWGSGPSTPTRAPRDKERFADTDPDDYTEPPVGNWEPDAEPSIEADFEEESAPDDALTCTLPKSGTSTEESICERYQAGESLPALATQHEMTPADVVRHLRDAGVAIRGTSTEVVSLTALLILTDSGRVNGFTLLVFGALAGLVWWLGRRERDRGER